MGPEGVKREVVNEDDPDDDRDFELAVALGSVLDERVMPADDHNSSDDEDIEQQYETIK
jgi:hypothetical protein